MGDVASVSGWRIRPDGTRVVFHSKQRDASEARGVVGDRECPANSAQVSVSRNCRRVGSGMQGATSVTAREVTSSSQANV